LEGTGWVRRARLIVEPVVNLVLVALLVFQFDWDLGTEGRSDVHESGDQPVCRIR
jgi:hypothetical protein